MFIGNAQENNSKEKRKRGSSKNGNEVMKQSLQLARGVIKLNTRVNYRINI